MKPMRFIFLLAPVGWITEYRYPDTAARSETFRGLPAEYRSGQRRRPTIPAVCLIVYGVQTAAEAASAFLIRYKSLFRDVPTLQLGTGFVIFFFILLSYYFLPGRRLRPGRFLFPKHFIRPLKTVRDTVFRGRIFSFRSDSVLSGLAAGELLYLFSPFRCSPPGGFALPL